jgi:hypothetical protein
MGGVEGWGEWRGGWGGAGFLFTSTFPALPLGLAQRGSANRMVRTKQNAPG